MAVRTVNWLREFLPRSLWPVVDFLPLPSSFNYHGISNVHQNFVDFLHEGALYLSLIRRPTAGTQTSEAWVIVLAESSVDVDNLPVIFSTSNFSGSTYIGPSSLSSGDLSRDYVLLRPFGYLQRPGTPPNPAFHLQSAPIALFYMALRGESRWGYKWLEFHADPTCTRVHLGTS